MESIQQNSYDVLSTEYEGVDKAEQDLEDEQRNWAVREEELNRRVIDEKTKLKELSSYYDFLRYLTEMDTSKHHKRVLPYTFQNKGFPFEFENNNPITDKILEYKDFFEVGDVEIKIRVIGEIESKKLKLDNIDDNGEHEFIRLNSFHFDNNDNTPLLCFFFGDIFGGIPLSINDIKNRQPHSNDNSKVIGYITAKMKYIRLKPIEFSIR